MYQRVYLTAARHNLPPSQHRGRHPLREGRRHDPPVPNDSGQVLASVSFVSRPPVVVNRRLVPAEVSCHSRHQRGWYRVYAIQRNASAFGAF
ncbi:MAG: hypothetical protein ACLU9S_22810 [Oscillospiraceae bacterium]